MQRRYNASVGYTDIPEANGEYSISLEGIVRDKGNRTIPIVRLGGGDLVVHVDLWG